MVLHTCKTATVVTGRAQKLKEKIPKTKTGEASEEYRLGHLSTKESKPET